jgi:hypothetical protein
MTKIHFICFGGPNTIYHNAIKRLHNQALSFNLFDSITCYTEKDLMSDSTFWNKHGNFILSNRRGYGYWIWKPYLIYKKLSEIDTNDILLYLDSGCELNINGKLRLLELIKLTQQKLILATSSLQTELIYSKQDLIEFMSMQSHPLLTQSQAQAGALIIKKCQTTIDFYKEFYQICQNYHFIDDSPSKLQNHHSFKEHRHDQSVFSLLLKKYNLLNYDLDPTYFGDGPSSKLVYNKKAISYPIWYCRNRSGNSFLS